MNAITVLQKLLAGVNYVFHDVVNDITDDEWISRGAPNQNMLGYTAWHIPRTQDFHVQTWIRGIPEIVHSDQWARWNHLRPLGNGVGISLDEADKIARETNQADVIEYADAVQKEISSWLNTLSENDLDTLTDTKHLSIYPEYQTPGFLEEASGLFDQPIWRHLFGPCIGHLRGHLGELDILKTILRTGK